MLAITFRTCGTRSVRSFEPHVETVLGEAVDSREVLRDDRDGVKLDTIGDFMLLGRQDNECVLAIQDFSCCSE